MKEFDALHKAWINFKLSLFVLVELQVYYVLDKAVILIERVKALKRS